jgi:GNAT superfamily N-acetyltransferase
MSNRIRPLRISDVSQAFALSQAVGWNHTPADWSLAIEMNPDGCFAMELDGAVVATTTTIRYGTDLAWIGMVLTHPEFRGRGYARGLMQQALEHLADVRTIKLDATEMGQPLYKSLGFVDECPIERWIGPAQLSAPISADSHTPQLILDREAFGADRRELLTRLAGIGAASSGEAFAMGRGNRFGPCVSRSSDAALALGHWFLNSQPVEQIIWDLFPENNLAQSLGFEFGRRLTRMVSGPALADNHRLIYACAGFEFG